MTCWIIHVSYVFISSYVQVKMSWYLLNKLIRACLSLRGESYPYVDTFGIRLSSEVDLFVQEGGNLGLGVWRASEMIL